MRFTVHHQEGRARLSTLSTSHGDIQTPVFMPVGTLGAVKTVAPAELESIGTQIILGNTYHLYLRPGLEILKTFAGLHRFMGWSRPILTDSGGFQVFSLGRLKKVTEDGAVFQSHLNGDTIHLTPELSAQIQQVIGSDIAMVLDECVALPNSSDILSASVHRSHRWAKRFLDVSHSSEHQAVFGIVQGGTDRELRFLSLQLTQELPVQGIAVGGLSVGEPFTMMMQVLDDLAPGLDSARPRYLMGVGTPRDILEAVYRGIDMFDCVLPTRNARNGGLFTDSGLLNIRNQQYERDEGAIDPSCGCLLCQKFSRAYLRHLFTVKETLGLRLATLHNLYYYHAFMQQIRSALAQRTFEEFYRSRRDPLARAYPGRKDL